MRAVAVLGVVLNHAGWTALPGGFVGVDVFFVISGFLISRIITDRVTDVAFSLPHFYERRARRILPALLPVIALSLVAGYAMLLPDDYENLGQSAVATLVFSNNILLTLTSGYWDLTATFKPLLHTWSLGVEEQFYLLYPLAALLVLRRWPGWFGWVLGGGFAVSLTLAIWGGVRHPDAAFYLLHSRAFELLLGALTARIAPRVAVPQRSAAALALAGLAMILAAMLMIDGAAAYPSWRGLIPCIGTATILMVGTAAGPAQRLLGWGPLVTIGLASYSIYLWHQPLFAFARAAAMTPPDGGTMAALTLATLAIGYASWRWIEQPFRDPARWPVRHFLPVVIGASALLAAAGFAIDRSAGLPQRVPGMGLERGDYAAYNLRILALRRDRFAQTRRPRLLVAGNSTARDMVNAMLESGRMRGFDIVYRDDIHLCSLETLRGPARTLVATADAIVFSASTAPIPARCRADAPARAAVLGQRPWVMIGPKHFGYNLNATIRLTPDKRPVALARLLPETAQTNASYATAVPRDHYIDLIATMERRYGGVPLFDPAGRLVSVDRIHLTRAGAAFLAPLVLEDPAFRSILSLSP